MSYFVVDVESDGPCPGLYSMISFGAVLVQEDLKNTATFYGELKPISNDWIPRALEVSGFTREQTESFSDPSEVMNNFHQWVWDNSKGRPIFISDNNGFDWQFINYYLWKYVNENIFGFSSRRLADLYCGMQKDSFAKWKHLRNTKHTHNPVDDAMGNAEVLVKMKNMGLKIRF
jgi:DNA polymerase III alpha subunit (gram-positive type)